MKLFRTIVCIGIIALVFLISGGFLWIRHWLSIPSSDGIALHLVIKNLTSHEIGPFVVSDARNSISLHIAPVKPLSTSVVDFVTPEAWGENAIVMTDPNGQSYVVVGYFEHSISGRVDIIVECASAEGLSGRHREITSYFFSFDWLHWGIPECVLPSQ